jgi:hypothetical protein
LTANSHENFRSYSFYGRKKLKTQNKTAPTKVGAEEKGHV